MRKLILFVPFFALAACSSAEVETQTCTFDMKNKTKVCELTSREISTIDAKIKDVEPQVLGYTTVEGKPYSIMSDGTVVPSTAVAAN